MQQKKEKAYHKHTAENKKQLFGCIVFCGQFFIQFNSLVIPIICYWLLINF